MPGGPAASPSFVAGAIIAFVAALFSNFGTNLMKSCHMDIERAPPDRRRPYYTYRKWWCAFALTVGGALGDFVALGLASQPLVASLGGGTTLVANVYIANRMNGEKIMRSDLIGVALVVLGAIIFAIMGASNTTATVTLAIMEARFQRPGFIVYAVVQTCVILALLSSVATSAVYRWRDGLTQLLLKPFSLRLKLLEQRMDLELEYLRLEVTALREDVASTNQIARRLSHGGTEEEDKVSEALRRRTSSAVRAARRPLKELRKLEDDAKHNWKDAYVYAATSGAIGAVSVLFAGCSSKSIIEAFNNPESQPFTRPLPYVFIVGMVVCIVLQQDFLNKALMRGDTMTIFPVFQVFWISLGVAGGLTFYQEEVSSTVEEIIAYLCMAGGFCFLVQHGRNGASYRPLDAEQAARRQSSGGGADGAGGARGAGGEQEVEMMAANPPGMPLVENPVQQQGVGVGGAAAERQQRQSEEERKVSELEQSAQAVGAYAQRTAPSPVHKPSKAPTASGDAPKRITLNLAD